MGKFEGVTHVGLRNKDTGKIVAVYPSKPEGDDNKVRKTVTDWYYRQNCMAEEELRNCYVDFLTDKEIKNLCTK